MERASDVGEDGLHKVQMKAVYTDSAMNTTRIMAEKRRLIVPLMLAIVANVLLYAVVVFPLGRQVVERRGGGAACSAIS